VKFLSINDNDHKPVVIRTGERFNELAFRNRYRRFVIIAKRQQEQGRLWITLHHNLYAFNGLSSSTRENPVGYEDLWCK
jgi:hypothetical protein